MGARAEFDSETEILVQQVKAEMQLEGLRYCRRGRSPLLDKEPMSGKRNKVITPARPYSPPENNIQFRGTQKRRSRT